jgi:hypothetical protein
MNILHAFQTRYSWPEEELTEDGAVVEKGTVHIKVIDIKC